MRSKLRNINVLIAMRMISIIVNISLSGVSLNHIFDFFIFDFLYHQRVEILKSRITDLKARQFVCLFVCKRFLKKHGQYRLSFLFRYYAVLDKFVSQNNTGFNNLKEYRFSNLL